MTNLYKINIFWFSLKFNLNISPHFVIFLYNSLSYISSFSRCLLQIPEYVGSKVWCLIISIEADWCGGCHRTHNKSARPPFLQRAPRHRWWRGIFWQYFVFKLTLIFFGIYEIYILWQRMIDTLFCWPCWLSLCWWWLQLKSWPKVSE